MSGGDHVSDPTTPIARAGRDAEDAIARAEDRTEDAIDHAEERAETAVHRAADAAKDRIHRTESRVKDAIGTTEARVRSQVDQAQRTFGDLKGLSEPTTATSSQEAADQARDLRRAIDRDLDALRSQLPAGDELQDRARVVGGAALGIGAAAVALAISSKQRRERKQLEREAKAHAIAISRYLPGASSDPIVPPSGTGSKLVLTLLALAGAGFAALTVARARRGGGAEEPDLWGPADPLA